MKRKTLAFVHTSSTLRPVFEQLCKDKHLDVDVMHISDDTLIQDVIADGALTESTSKRVLDHLTTAEKSVADYIMVTCSSIGPAVDAARSQLHKPVFRVDLPLADHAVQLGNKIGVVATLATTLNPTAELIRHRAEEAGKEIEIKAELCQGAFDALMGGNPEKHDAAVVEAVKNLAKEVDVIVLAQASMARVVEDIPDGEITIPVLSSPSLAIDYLATVL